MNVPTRAPADPGESSGLKPLRADARRNRARILEAAEAVFAEKGASASTEEVASRAGVAIGTVFRHFPTKNDLLAAIVKNLLLRLTDEVHALISDGDAGTALFEFFAGVVEQAAGKKSVLDLLAETGVRVDVNEPVQAVLRDAVATLLAMAQRAGAVRAEVGIGEVMALLAATSQAAIRSGWDHDLQRRTLGVIFAGLRPAEQR